MDPSSLDIPGLHKLDGRRHEPEDVEEIVDGAGSLAEPAVVAAAVLEGVALALGVPPGDDVAEDFLENLATALGLEDGVGDVGALAEEAGLAAVGVEADPGAPIKVLHGAGDVVVEDLAVPEDDGREPRREIGVHNRVEPVHSRLEGLEILPLGGDGGGGFLILELQPGGKRPEGDVLRLGLRVEPLAGEQMAEVNVVLAVVGLGKGDKLRGQLRGLSPPGVPLGDVSHGVLVDGVGDVSKSLGVRCRKVTGLLFEKVWLGTR